MKELTLDADTLYAPVLIDFINAELEAAGCSAANKARIDVAVDEIFSNIAAYAYAPGAGKVTVQVETIGNPPAVRIMFIDTGNPFDPLEEKEPDITVPAESRSLGGLGIFLVKKTMDDIRYKYRDGKNILSILKNL